MSKQFTIRQWMPNYDDAVLMSSKLQQLESMLDYNIDQISDSLDILKDIPPDSIIGKRIDHKNTVKELKDVLKEIKDLHQVMVSNIPDKPCPNCVGLGTVINKPCKYCDGYGIVDEKHAKGLEYKLLETCSIYDEMESKNVEQV